MLYKFEHFEKCIHNCNQALEQCIEDMPMKRKLLLCKGKAYAQLYLQQRTFFLHNTFYNTNAALRNCDNVQKLNSYGKNATLLLGDSLDELYIDEEGTKLLDWVMIDFGRETCLLDRCPLCRKKSDDNFFVNFNVPLFISISNIFTKHLPASTQYGSLCKECFTMITENERLVNDKVLEILNDGFRWQFKYESDFYKGCIAKILLGLLFTFFPCMSNNDDLYNLFLDFKEYLLSPEIKRISLPDVHLLFTTTFSTVAVNPFTYSFQTLHFPTSMIFSYMTSPSCRRCNQFFVHSASMSLVVNFSKKSEFTKSSVLVRKGGILKIFQDFEYWPTSWILFFKALLKIDYLYDDFINKLSKEDIEREFSFSLISKQLTRYSDMLSLLPAGFKVDPDQEAGQVHLPPGHALLNHYHNESDSPFTLVLAADCTSSNEIKFYTIFVYEVKGFTIVDGIYLNTTQTDLIVPVTSDDLLPSFTKIAYALRKYFWENHSTKFAIAVATIFCNYFSDESYSVVPSHKVKLKRFVYKFYSRCRARDGKRTETRIGMEGICITHSCIPLYTVYMQHIMAHSGGMQEWVIQIPSTQFFLHP